MNEVLENLPDTPENREKLYKESLRQARICLCNAQEIVRPYDERWQKLNELLEPLEEMITTPNL